MLAALRLIPARAGNTSNLPRRAEATPAHPRSRGEHCSVIKLTKLFVGSSPLARGTRAMANPALGRRRLIPARAGNTSAGDGEPVPVTAHPRSRGEHGVMAGTPHTNQAHPRSRGEHEKNHVCSRRTDGSSPLARGTPTRRGHSLRARRLIPARAGNTNVPGGCEAGLAAHPRSRGEHLLVCSRRACSVGSSPLARGTQTAIVVVIAIIRLIPARAGNTLDSPPPHPETQAHPRSRGEHNDTAEAIRDANGSSPLARGTPVKAAAALDYARLIPARAGNTKMESRHTRRQAAHPRSRGEH